jgi:hypothetical protein
MKTMIQLFFIFYPVRAPGPIRTADLLLRRELLYPSELQAQKMFRNLVGVLRFELRTSASQTQRSTKLSHTPVQQAAAWFIVSGKIV